MARRKQSKSDRIRAALTELGPEARNRDVIEKLAAENVQVSAQMVSTVRKRAGDAIANGVSDVRGPGRPPRRAAAASVSLRGLLQAKHLVAESGSVEAARQALQVLGQLV